MSESLEEIAKRLSRQLTDAATGPLIVAAEIVKLGEIWDEPPEPRPASHGANAVNTEPSASLREQAGGGSCDQWIRRKVDPGGLAFFAARDKAVKKLGEASRRTVHHEVAVWVERNVPDVKLDEVKLALMRGAKAQSGNPLKPTQAQRVLRKILGHVAQVKAPCKRCAALEKALSEAGIDVPE